MNRIRFASLLVVAALATACASVPMAPPEADKAAKEYKTIPGKTNVYVFRDEGYGGAVKMPVLLNGRAFGDTAAHTFLLATVDPGPQTLVSKTENDAKLEFVAKPGSNVFVWQEVKMGAWAARSELHLLDAAEAMPRVNECNLAQGELPFQLPGLPAAPPKPAGVPNT
jgi:hypothetical protein